MVEKVVSNGIEYNVEITMYSMNLLQKAKGLKISQIGQLMTECETEMDNLIIMSELCYYGAKDYLINQGKDIEVTEQQFVRGIKGGQMTAITNAAMDYFGDLKTEENKRPLKVKTK